MDPVRRDALREYLHWFDLHVYLAAQDRPTFLVDDEMAACLERAGVRQATGIQRRAGR